MKYLQILSLVIICNFLYGKTVLTATSIAVGQVNQRFIFRVKKPEIKSRFR